ncbi:MAG: nucleotide exchange factor GrpE [Euryarchaeota archaeon]|nr:nucleotide exchange factor GrpE [Euryarchaeota archaeon]
MTEKDENEDLDVESLLRERDEYRDKYLRKLAEMDNYRKMLEKEKNMELERCRAEIIKLFIEPYENLQRAAQKLKDEGIELVLKQMKKAMDELGVKEIEAIGMKFDPMLHEAISIVDGEEDDVVVEVYQKGYTLNGMVLRHAKVLVSKKKEVKENE